MFIMDKWRRIINDNVKYNTVYNIIWITWIWKENSDNVQSIVIPRCYYESVIKLHSLLLRVQREINIWYLTCTRV